MLYMQDGVKSMMLGKVPTHESSRNRDQRHDDSIDYINAIIYCIPLGNYRMEICRGHHPRWITSLLDTI